MNRSSNHQVPDGNLYNAYDGSRDDLSSRHSMGNTGVRTREHKQKGASPIFAGGASASLPHERTSARSKSTDATRKREIPSRTRVKPNLGSDPNERTSCTSNFSSSNPGESTNRAKVLVRSDTPDYDEGSGSANVNGLDSSKNKAISSYYSRHGQSPGNVIGGGSSEEKSPSTGSVKPVGNSKNLVRTDTPNLDADDYYNSLDDSKKKEISSNFSRLRRNSGEKGGSEPSTESLHDNENFSNSSTSNGRPRRRSTVGEDSRPDLESLNKERYSRLSSDGMVGLKLRERDKNSRTNESSNLTHRSFTSDRVRERSSQRRERSLGATSRTNSNDPLSLWRSPDRASRIRTVGTKEYMDDEKKSLKDRYRKTAEEERHPFASSKETAGKNERNSSRLGSNEGTNELSEPSISNVERDMVSPIITPSDESFLCASRNARRVKSTSSSQSHQRIDNSFATETRRPLPNLNPTVFSNGGNNCKGGSVNNGPSLAMAPGSIPTNMSSTATKVDSKIKSVANKSKNDQPYDPDRFCRLGSDGMVGLKRRSGAKNRSRLARSFNAAESSSKGRISYDGQEDASILISDENNRPLSSSHSNHDCVDSQPREKYNGGKENFYCQNETVKPGSRKNAVSFNVASEDSCEKEGKSSRLSSCDDEPKSSHSTARKSRRSKGVPSPGIHRSFNVRKGIDPCVFNDDVAVGAHRTTRNTVSFALDSQKSKVDSNNFIARRCKSVDDAEHAVFQRRTNQTISGSDKMCKSVFDQVARERCQRKLNESHNKTETIPKMNPDKLSRPPRQIRRRSKSNPPPQIHRSFNMSKLVDSSMFNDDNAVGVGGNYSSSDKTAYWDKINFILFSQATESAQSSTSSQFAGSSEILSECTTNDNFEKDRTRNDDHYEQVPIFKVKEVATLFRERGSGIQYDDRTETKCDLKTASPSSSFENTESKKSKSLSEPSDASFWDKDKESTEGGTKTNIHMNERSQDQAYNPVEREHFPCLSLKDAKGLSGVLADEKSEEENFPCLSLKEAQGLSGVLTDEVSRKKCISEEMGSKNRSDVDLDMSGRADYFEENNEDVPAGRTKDLKNGRKTEPTMDGAFAKSPIKNPVAEALAYAARKGAIAGVPQEEEANEEETEEETADEMQQKSNRNSLTEEDELCIMRLGSAFGVTMGSSERDDDKVLKDSQRSRGSRGSFAASLRSSRGSFAAGIGRVRNFFTLRDSIAKKEEEDASWKDEGSRSLLDGISLNDSLRDGDDSRINREESFGSDFERGSSRNSGSSRSGSRRRRDSLNRFVQSAMGRSSPRASHRRSTASDKYVDSSLDKIVEDSENNHSNERVYENEKERGSSSEQKIPEGNNTNCNSVALDSSATILEATPIRSVRNNRRESLSKRIMAIRRAAPRKPNQQHPLSYITADSRRQTETNNDEYEPKTVSQTDSPKMNRRRRRGSVKDIFTNIAKGRSQAGSPGSHRQHLDSSNSDEERRDSKARGSRGQTLEENRSVFDAVAKKKYREKESASKLAGRSSTYNESDDERQLHWDKIASIMNA